MPISTLMFKKKENHQNKNLGLSLFLMAKEPQKKRRIRRKLLYKYRLLILNENTFEEKLSFKLSRLNVFVTGMLFIIILISLTTFIIAFTPLREYIPGYPSTQLKRQAAALTYKTDSLVTVLNYTNTYLNNIRLVLRGEIENNEVSRDSLFEKYKLDPASVDLTPIREDLLLREKVALEDKYNLFERRTKAVEFLLFSPLRGTVSQSFDSKTKHYAVDVAAPKDTPVKSIADGTVLFSEWTSETGYVIIIEHQDGFTSVYKHNGSLSKSQGDLVQAGEVVAFIGNTGEFTTGPHLHFELWKKGKPVNPLNYIDFD